MSTLRNVSLTRVLRRGAHAKPVRPKASRLIAGALGVALVGGGAFAATNWVVGLTAGSSGEGQSAAVTNLTITAVATPAASNQLFPGASGDVVLTITNPNNFPVTLTGVNLPTSTTYAGGFSNSTLASAQSGCSSTTSLVSWSYATGTSGSAHTLTTPIVVGPTGNANDPLTVTLTNDAAMAATTPAACENTYFSMPSLTGIAASASNSTVTVTPLVDAWTS